MNDGLLERLLPGSSVLVAIGVGPALDVTDVNAAFARQVGAPASDLVGEPLATCLTDPDAQRVTGWARGGDLPAGAVRLNFVTRAGSPFTLRCALERDEGTLRIVGEPETTGERRVAEELMRLNNELATVARERARRERELERTRKRLQATLEELETSYWHLKKIQEVLPLCMRCGKVKAGEARWESVVDYLRENEIFTSHGYCPSCVHIVLEEYGLDSEGDVG